MSTFDLKTPIALGMALTLAGCVEPAVKPELGPMKYDAGGTMPCSANAPTFDQACGWRVVRKHGGAAEIWISNIASKTKPAYRVLDFFHGEFTTRDGAPLQVARDADTWSVSVAGKEFYRFADAVITGG